MSYTPQHCQLPVSQSWFPNKNNIAIIDETPCFHDDIKSSLNDVSKRGDHSKEGSKLYEKYNIKPYKKTIYKTLKK